MSWEAAIGALGGLASTGITQGVGNFSSGQAWSRQKRVLQEGVRWRFNDLRAAGINPILAAGYGGASGSVQQMPVADFAGGMTGLARAGTEAGLAGPEKKKRKEQTQQVRAQTGVLNKQKDALQAEINNKNADTALKGQAQALAFQQTIATAEQARANAANATLSELAIPQAETMADIESSEFGQWLRKIERGASTASSVIEAVHPVGQLMRIWQENRRNERGIWLHEEKVSPQGDVSTTTRRQGQVKKPKTSKRGRRR